MYIYIHKKYCKKVIARQILNHITSLKKKLHKNIQVKTTHTDTLSERNKYTYRGKSETIGIICIENHFNNKKRLLNSKRYELCTHAHTHTGSQANALNDSE